MIAILEKKGKTTAIFVGKTNNSVPFRFSVGAPEKIPQFRVEANCPLSGQKAEIWKAQRIANYPGGIEPSFLCDRRESSLGRAGMEIVDRQLRNWRIWVKKLGIGYFKSNVEKRRRTPADGKPVRATSFIRGEWGRGG